MYYYYILGIEIEGKFPIHFFYIVVTVIFREQNLHVV